MYFFNFTNCVKCSLVIMSSAQKIWLRIPHFIRDAISGSSNQHVIECFALYNDFLELNQHYVGGGLGGRRLVITRYCLSAAAVHFCCSLTAASNNTDILGARALEMWLHCQRLYDTGRDKKCPAQPIQHFIKIVNQPAAAYPTSRVCYCTCGAAKCHASI